MYCLGVLRFKKAGLLSLLFLMPVFISAGCASLKSISIAPIPSNRSRIVRAEVSRMSFFKVNFNNSYVDELIQKLVDQCPNGSIEGILTKEERYYYIYFLIEETRVSAKGYCNSKI